MNQLDTQHTERHGEQGGHGHGGHGWMMMICCVPVRMMGGMSGQGGGQK